MNWEADVVSALGRNGISVVAYLPDSALAGLIDRIEADHTFTGIRLAREEGGVGVLSGAWLGGERGALVCQSSGLATTINALASLSKPARIPFVGIVSRRGDLGEFNLAQVPFGYAAGAVLDDVGIRHRELDGSTDIERAVDLAVETAFATDEPYVLLFESELTGTKDEF